MVQYNLFDKKPSGFTLDVDAYLRRIQCVRELKPSLRFLRVLHKNHMLHIPFENLDIHVGNQIILDVGRLYRKVILNGRGGFCYELNGLFYHLLLALGFEAQLIAARVINAEGMPGPELDHCLIVVEIDAKLWLVDVGFGDAFLSPKELSPGKVQMDGNKYYRVVDEPDGNFMLQQSADSITFKNIYTFHTEKRQLVEFIAMCQYHQTNPKSHFTQKKLITQATPAGRVTLSDKKLTVTHAGKKEETPILNNDQFLVKLYEYFGIKLRKNA